jgi:hypothetical protein
MQKAVSRVSCKTYRDTLVRDSWIIELVHFNVKILACALKNKIKNKNFLNY